MQDGEPIHTQQNGLRELAVRIGFPVVHIFSCLTTKMIGKIIVLCQQHGTE